MTPLLLVHCFLVLVNFPSLSVAAAGAACSSGVYKELLFLSNFAPAESYCSEHYPLPVLTVTATSKSPNRHRRAATTSTSLSTAFTTTVKATGTEAVWSALLSSAQSLISTACSCIETASTKTITITSSKTKSMKSSTSSTKSSSSKSISTKGGSTKTSSTRTSSSTSRSTPTATACNPGGAQPTFYLLATAPGTIDDGRYAFQSNTGDSDLVTFVPTAAEASTFTFDDACHLIGFGTPGTPEIANIDVGATNETVFFNTAAQIAAQSNPAAVAATCNIAGGVLKCTDQTTTIFFVCTNQLQLQIGNTVPPEFPIGGPAGSTSGPCEELTLTPVYT